MIKINVLIHCAVFPTGSESPSVQVTSVPASLVPYSLSLVARVSSPHPLSKVESNCSLEPLQYLNAEQTYASVSSFSALWGVSHLFSTVHWNLYIFLAELQVKLSADHKFDRDVELLIYYKEAHKPSAVVEAPKVSAKPGESVENSCRGVKSGKLDLFLRSWRSYGDSKVLKSWDFWASALI